MRYLISGYYGEKNAGDEAILAGIVQEVGRRDPDAYFTVLSFDPEDTLWRHGNSRNLAVLPTSLRSPRTLRAAMRTADLLISGGGSFLHEADFELYGRSFLLREGKLRPVPYFLSIVLMARAQGLPVMWYAQGLGPLHTRAARRLVAVAASASQAVTWRDPSSARLAHEIGVRAPVELVVPDPAYALTPASAEAARSELSRAGLGPETRFIAVCPRPWLGRMGYVEALGEALEKAVSLLGVEVVLVPFHEVQDPPVCETVAARPGLAGRAHVLAPVRSPAVLAAVLGEAELVVAMRLHSGILAATAGTPAVVVDYDPKTRAFASQTGQARWAVSVDELEGVERSEKGAAAPYSCAVALSSEAVASCSGATAPSSGAAALLAAIVDTTELLPARRAALARAVAPLRTQAGRTAGLAVQLASSGGFATPDVSLRRRARGGGKPQQDSGSRGQT